MIANTGCLALAACLLIACSQAGNAQEIACNGAPKEAVVEVPDKIKDLAAVVCTKYGHLLTGVEGTIWTYPGAMAPAFLFAYLDGADSEQIPPEVNHTKYFSSINVRDVPPAETAALLSEDGMAQRPSKASVTAMEISVTNQDRIDQKAYIFTSGTDHWGYLCDPKCRPKDTFMVLDMRSQANGT